MQTSGPATFLTIGAVECISSLSTVFLRFGHDLSLHGIPQNHRLACAPRRQQHARVRGAVQLRRRRLHNTLRRGEVVLVLAAQHRTAVGAPPRCHQAQHAHRAGEQYRRSRAMPQCSRARDIACCAKRGGRGSEVGGGRQGHHTMRAGRFECGGAPALPRTSYNPAGQVGANDIHVCCMNPFLSMSFCPFDERCAQILRLLKPVTVPT